MLLLSPKPLAVLLIEEDPHYANLLLNQIRHFAAGEFDVVQARTLESAIDEASNGDYQLAVIDVALSGFEVSTSAYEFKIAFNGTPWIVLNPTVGREPEQNLEDAGAKAVLLKGDFSGSELVAAMRTASAQNDRPALTPPATLSTLLAEVA